MEKFDDYFQRLFAIANSLEKCVSLAHSLWITCR